jgi:hypothetical protein
VRVRARITDRRHPSGVRQGSARTGRDGSFTISELPSATFNLEASSREHPGASLSGVVPGGAPVEIRLPEAVSISGRATDLSGNPLRGIRVRARGERGSSGQATTAEDGTFEIRGISPGPYSIRAQSRTGGWREATLDGVEGGTRGLEIRLAPAAVLAGRVLAPDGSPAPGRGRIRVLDGSGKQVGSTRWDGQGGFQIENLAEGTYTLVARVEGPPVLQASVTARPGPDPIEIRLATE